MPALRAKITVYGRARPPFFKAATRAEAVDGTSFTLGDTEGFPEEIFVKLESDNVFKQHGAEVERGSAIVGEFRVPALATVHADQGGVAVMEPDYYRKLLKEWNMEQFLAGLDIRKVW